MIQVDAEAPATEANCWPRQAGPTDMVDFFQHNRDGEPKGIIRIDLSQLP